MQCHLVVIVGIKAVAFFADCNAGARQTAGEAFIVGLIRRASNQAAFVRTAGTAWSGVATNAARVAAALCMASEVI